MNDALPKREQECEIESQDDLIGVEIGPVPAIGRFIWHTKPLLPSLKARYTLAHRVIRWSRHF
jgi:hypothetical protein